MYSFVRVDRHQAEASEQLGTKRKFWYRDSEGRRMLFKAEERGTGEDWAEKIACELCELLGLPHVHYELAEEYDLDAYRQPGVVCPTCALSTQSLVLGNQLLLALDSDYPAEEQRKYKVNQHTVENVARAVALLELPSKEWMAKVPATVTTAHDVFVGYLMLDAWIANQDRHHENWGALFNGTELQLAPTFDHGASLARNHTDEDRKDRLTTDVVNRQIPHFVKKARSAIYGQVSDERPLGTHEAFWRFASDAPEAATGWLSRLGSIDGDAIQDVLNEVPNRRMSSIAKEFTLRLLLVNQERLLEENPL